MTIHFLKISRGKNNLPRYAGHGFCNKYGRASSFPPQTIQDFGDMARVTVSEVGFSSPVDTAIIVWDWSDVNPRLASASARSIEFVRTYVDECGGVAVVGMLQNDGVVVSCKSTSKAKSEFVGFA